MSKKQSSILLLCVSAFVILVILGIAIFKIVSGNETMRKFNKYYNSNKNTVIYYARTGCGYCSMQSPILERLAEVYDFDYLKLDSSKLTKKQISTITSKLEIEDATPMTVIVKNGKVVAQALGYKSSSTYVEFLKENGIIPEDAYYSYEDAPNIEVIDYNKYENLINNGEQFIVTVGQTGCGHCTAFKPVIDRIVEKKDLKIYYLNLTDLLNNERSDFYQSLTDLEFSDPDYVERGSFGTPTTFTIENGKIKYYFSGERSYPRLVTEFEKQGLISE